MESFIRQQRQFAQQISQSLAPGLMRYNNSIVEQQKRLAEQISQSLAHGLMRYNNPIVEQQKRLAEQISQSLAHGLMRYNNPIVEQQKRLAEQISQSLAPGLRTFHNPIVEQQKRLAEQMARTFASPNLLAVTRALMFPDLRWWRHISKQLTRLGLLPNWRSIDAINLNLVEELLWQGIPLAVVPRASTVQILLSAESHSSRRRVLSSRWRGICVDCYEALAQLQPSAGVKFTGKAIDALRDGHVEAAQALAANVIDTLLRLDLHPNFRNALRSNSASKGYTRPQIDQWVTLAAWVFRPIWAAYRQYWSPTDLTQAPRIFLRHASAHGVSQSVYNRPNAVTAIMLATSLRG